MKTKLVPLALLIPVVVLAQSDPIPPAQADMPLSNMMQNPPVRPANPAEVLSNAKQQAKEITSKQPSNNMYGVSHRHGSGLSDTVDDYYRGRLNL